MIKTIKNMAIQYHTEWYTKKDYDRKIFKNYVKLVRYTNEAVMFADTIHYNDKMVMVSAIKDNINALYKKYLYHLNQVDKIRLNIIQSSITRK